MQRLHQKDVVGHVLEQGRWDVAAPICVGVLHGRNTPT
jgi:hypothetical protein